MEQRVSLITLGVADLARAKGFYEGVLGWQAKDGPPGVVFFDLGGLVFGLYPHDALAAEMGLEVGTLGRYRGGTLAHNLRSEADVDDLFVRLAQRDVTILKMPEKVFWGGYSGYFADPDGHIWEAAFNPFWPLDDAGRVSLP